MGKRVKLFTPTGDERLEPATALRAHLVLAAGTNYGVAALEAGAVRIARQVTPAALTRVFQLAQDTAVAGKYGLWGAACPGNLAAGTSMKNFRAVHFLGLEP